MKGRRGGVGGLCDARALLGIVCVCVCFCTGSPHQNEWLCVVWMHSTAEGCIVRVPACCVGKPSTGGGGVVTQLFI